MKKLTLLTTILLTATVALGQGVAISETGAEPDPSAMLDVTSTEKGILIPRITQAQRDAISNPATGLLIYQSDETPGFYYNAGSPATPLWKRIGEDLSQITGQWEKSLDNIFYNQGFVGIGTANPEAILDVSGGDVLIQGITAGRGGGNMTQNTVFGNQALLSNTDGERNTAIGYWAMYGNYTGGGDGEDNTALGWASLGNSSAGSRNTALGTSALTTNSIGHNNVAVGYQSLVENAAGSANVAVGYQAGFEINGGNNNILLGYRAGNNITTGSNNVIIGNDIEALPAGSNQMVIGAPDLLYGDLTTKRIGIGTTTPTALLHTVGTGTGEGNVLFEGSYKPSDPGDPPASGAGIRMMWYPDKAAFRAGRVTGTNWDKDSIGYYSVAMGYNTIATGVASTAMGGETTASGVASTAMGGETTASGYSSTAMGALTTAKSSYETVIGRLNSDYTPQSTTGWDPGDRLFVIGNGTSSTERSNAMTVLKNGNTGLGTDTPTALLHTNGTGTGQGNVLFEGSYKYPEDPGDPPASGAGTRMMWYPDKAAFRVGRVTGTEWNKDKIGNYSMAMGHGTTASGVTSTAMGRYTLSTGDYSTAMGNLSIAWGNNSMAMGVFTEALGHYSTAMGYNTRAKSAYETVIGRNNTIYTPQDSLNWNDSDRLFVIGNGTSGTNRSNALTMLKNGNTGFGVDIPTQKLDIDGQIRIRGGAPGNGKVLTSDGNGVASWQTPSYSNWTVAGANIYRASGNVGIGTSAPGELLHVRNTSGTAKIRVQSTNMSAIDFYNNTAYVAGIGVSVSEGHLFLYNGGNVSVKGGNLGIGNINPGQRLDITAGNGRVQSGYSWLTNSDIRYKKNVSTLENVLEKVSNLRGVRYDLTEVDDSSPGHGKHIGFIAQELETEFPEFVVTGDDGYKSVAYDKMTAVLLQAVKEQQAIIETMMHRIEMLEVER